MKIKNINVHFTEAEIDKKIRELGARISEDYAGESVCLICILKGASFFTSGTESSGIVKIVQDLSTSIEGKNVIVVEDIIDTGRTLSYLLENLKTRSPKSVRLCTLLDKPERRVVDVKVDYVGFEIPDEFVVGYGLDYNQQYRNLPYIGFVEIEE